MDSTKFNKLLDEKYFLLQDIAKKYNYSEELLDMITVIYMSFYMTFGKKCDFPLYDLFNRVKIIYDIGTVNEISIKYGYGSMPDGSAAVTIFLPNFKVFDNPSLKQNPQTIILASHVEEYLATPALKLEMLTHEVRHALMGYFKTSILLDEKTYYMRSGLQETYYTRGEDTKEKIKSKRIGMTIDEVTNTYITGLLVNRIMDFKKYKIHRSNLKNYVDSIKTRQPDGKYYPIGYTSEVRLMYPLLLNSTFLNLVDQHEFDGDISVVRSFIEKNTDLCDYLEFCELLDTVFNGNGNYSKAIQQNNVDFVNKHINRINKVKKIVLDLNKNIGR